VESVNDGLTQFCHNLKKFIKEYETFSLFDASKLQVVILDLDMIAT